MKKLALYLFLIFTTSFTPIAARFIVNEISPLSLAFFRFGVAGVLFLVIFIFKKHNFKIDKEDRLRFLVLGILVIPINQFCFLKGVSLSTASHSGVMYSLTPLFSFFLSIKLKNELFSGKKLVSILISIVGIFIVFYESIMLTTKSESTMLWGDILLFFAVFSWAAYLTIGNDMVKKYGAIKTSTIAFWIGLILYIPVFIYDLPNFHPENISALGILSFIHLSLIVSFGGYFAFIYATKFIQVSSLTTTVNFSPIVTIIFAYILLKESLSNYFIIGAMITLIGVILIQSFNNSRYNKNGIIENI